MNLMPIRLAFFFASLTLLAAVHIAALELYLYWRFIWFDIPMHILGGITVALGYSLLPLLHIRVSPRFRTFAWYLIAVIVVGLSWELFEYALDLSLVFKEDFIMDTGIDIFMDVVGGIIGYGLVKGTAPLSE